MAWEKLHSALIFLAVFHFSKAAHVTKSLTVQSITNLKTETTTAVVTEYATCTVASPEVPYCPVQLAVLQYDKVKEKFGNLPPNSLKSSMESTTFDVAEVIMPACECPTERRQSRQEDNVLTILKTVTITSTYLTTMTDPSTTISYSYGGCIPQDAPRTTACP